MQFVCEACAIIGRLLSTMLKIDLVWREAFISGFENRLNHCCWPCLACIGILAVTTFQHIIFGTVNLNLNLDVRANFKCEYLMSAT